MIVPTDVDFEEYLALLGDQESQEIRPASDFEDRVLDLIVNGHQLTGDKLPWAKTHNCVRLRPGEVSIWSGINGHKKSMMLGQVMMWLARETRVCIASLEMRPEKTLERMYQQAAGCKPAVDFARKLNREYGDRVYIYDQLDTVEVTKLLGMVHYAATELKCSHIVIDSLMKCGIDGDDYNKQKKFVDRLCWAAKRHGVHVHLVAHVRKGMDETRRPGKFDVSGTGDLTNLVDNVFVSWSDKKREQIGKKMDFGMPLEEGEQDYFERTCDQMLIVPKQRDGEWEGSFKLWFHAPSLQFTPTDENRPLPFEV